MQPAALHRVQRVGVRPLVSRGHGVAGVQLLRGRGARVSVQRKSRVSQRHGVRRHVHGRAGNSIGTVSPHYLALKTPVDETAGMFHVTNLTPPGSAAMTASMFHVTNMTPPPGVSSNPNPRRASSSRSCSPCSSSSRCTRRSPWGGSWWEAVQVESS
jgi:hypothetical protein